MNEILLGALGMSLLHALLPNHWLPIVALGQRERWSFAQVMQTTLFAGAAHVVSTVLVECKDVEAMTFDHPDEKTRGLVIYKQILQRMDCLAKDEPERVCHEPKDTLMGIAGMLSGECKFAWGTPLEQEKQDGS